MIDWFANLNLKIQVVLISSFTSILVLVFGWIIKAVFERTSLNYKLKKEFEFEQKKKLKEDIAKNKVHLLNAAEEFSQRLWNLSQNVGENWHKVSKENWFVKEQYYINSCVYRFLVFIHWTIKTERDTISVDSTIADNADILFLKYIKTFKDIFTDADLLEELNYSREHNTNHFFKNDLIGYTKFVVFNNQVIDFDDFKVKIKNNYSPLEKVIEYFSNIEEDDLDKNLNVLRCSHLLIINFLNTFGHSYQKTDKEKIGRIVRNYKVQLKIIKGFQIFIDKSKLRNEMNSILKKFK